MPLQAVINTHGLDEGLILAPERYDPRRRIEGHSDLILSYVASEIHDTINPKKIKNNKQYIVLDTGDASEGMILKRKLLVNGSEVGSTKKIVQPGDVIISRLRPYLRQVALVDEGLVKPFGSGVVILCSTEFFVLRAKDEERISYLVPVLLGNNIQKILHASQEGGHHPRFNKATLMALPISSEIYENRKKIISRVEQAINQTREGVLEMRSLISECSEVKN